MVLLSARVSRVLCHFLAYVYPAYASFKAVRSGDPSAHASWLTYWIAQSYFLVFELVGDVVLAWFPMYWELKVALLIWLVAPRFNGAEKIYREVIHPYLARYETDIDRSIERLKDSGSERLGEMADAGVRHLRKGSNDLLKISQQAVLTGLLTAATTGAGSSGSSGSGRVRGGSVSSVSGSGPASPRVVIQDVSEE